MSTIKSNNKSSKPNNKNWRERLTPEQYAITRDHGTETPFTSPLNDEKREGSYKCVCCGAELFSSNAKYNSGSGWPSFFEPASEDIISQYEDRKLLMKRTEVRCADCDAHLGHVFQDGPAPTGLRYCINGLALDFQPKT